MALRSLLKKQQGFTLVELLVVIAIIGILATLLLLQLNTARSKARDTKRIADINQLRTAIEFYYTDNSNYPTALSQVSTYMANNAVPTDPLGTAISYCYAYSGTTKYQVWAQLENVKGPLNNDADIDSTGWTGNPVTGGTEAGTSGKCTTPVAGCASKDCVFDLGQN